MKRLLNDFSLSATRAGFVAALVGLTSAIAILFQATQSLGATPEQAASWMLALGLGTGLGSIGLSLWTRQPILIAWSIPGAALLAGSAGVGLPAAIGACMLASLLVAVAGATGWFERIMDRIPMAVASALLAGVLARFGLDAVLSARNAPLMAGLMLAAYLLGKQWWGRYAVPGAFLTGILVVVVQGSLFPNGLALRCARPVWVVPAFDVAALLGLGLPLFVLTMAAQNLPGVAALRAYGYRAPVSRILTLTGLAAVALAPLGGFSLNLAALTASVCMGPEAHADAGRRYVAVLVAGVFYLLIGLAGGLIMGLLLAFPRELVAAIAGIALLSSIAGGLATSLKEERSRDAAVLTFLVTLSGLNLAGLGSAFWGLAVGGLVFAWQRWRVSRP